MGSKKTATATVLVVLYRFALKRNGTLTGGIVSRVCAGDWTQENKHTYDVTLFCGKATSCTCAARGDCKHRRAMEEREQTRRDVEQRKRETAPLNGNAPFSLLRRAS